MSGRLLVRAFALITSLVLAVAGMLWSAPASADTVFSGSVSIPTGMTIVPGPFSTVDLASTSTDDGFSAPIDRAGNFTANVAEGLYGVQLHAKLSGPGGALSSVTGIFPEREFSEPAEQLQLALPVSSIDVHLRDSSGAPVDREVLLACSRDVVDAEGGGTHWSSTSRGTTTSGAITVTGVDIDDSSGLVGCRIELPMGEGLPPLRRTVDPGDGSVTITIPDSMVRLSGTIDWPFLPLWEGQGFVSVTTDDGANVGETVIAPEGTWSMEIWPGTYQVTVSPRTHNERGRFVRRGVVVDGTTELDATPDLSPVKVFVVDRDGRPVSGYLSASCRDNPTGAGSTLDVFRDLEPDGSAVLDGLVSSPPWECQVVVNNGTEGWVATDWFAIPAGNSVWTIDAAGHITQGAPTVSDQDGVPDSVESHGPNGGDGNGDGTPDYQQANVTSLPANGAAYADGVPYETIAGPAGTTLTDVSTTDLSSLPAPPAGVTLPSGLANFKLTGLDHGATKTVSIYPGDMTGVNGYAKYKEGSGWSVLPANRVHPFADHLDVDLTDGGIGDADGAADGTITDPGGVAKLVPSDSTPPAVVGVATTKPNAAGWYRSNVKVHWTANDPSGVAAQPADTIVNTEGANVTATSPQVCDKVAPTPNCGPGTLAGLKIDRTAPSLAVTGVVNGATYTLGAVTTVGCSASDSLSGLAGACKGLKVGGNSVGVGGFGYAAAVGDKAGNSRAAAASWNVVYGFSGFAAPLNDPVVTPGAPTSIFKAGSTVPVAFSLKRANGQVATPASKPVWVSLVKGAKTTASVNEAVSNVSGTSGSSFVWRNNRWEFNWATKGLSGGYLYRIGVKLDDGTTHYLNVGLR